MPKDYKPARINLPPASSRGLIAGAAITVGDSVREGPGIDVVAAGNQRTVGLGGDRVLLYHADGSPVSEYLSIAEALAAASPGDVVQPQAGTYAESFTIPSGVELVGRGRANTVITGQVTVLGSLRDVRIERSVNQAGAAYGILDGGGDATGHVRDVTVDVTNASGPARAVGVVNGGTLYCQDVEAATSGSEGYGYYCESGSLYIDGGAARSEEQTTAPLYVAT